MLRIAENVGWYVGRFLLCLLLGSWADTEPAIALPEARYFTLFAGGLVSSLAPGTVLYGVARYYSYHIDVFKPFVWFPLVIILITFVSEWIRNEIGKKTNQSSS